MQHLSEDLNLSFACTIYWQDSVPRHLIADVFRSISATLAAKDMAYFSVRQDKERHRKCIVSEKGTTCETLSVTLKHAIFEALEKEFAIINGKVLTRMDFYYYWTITEEHGKHVRRGDEDEIISKGSAAWHLLK
ncbi:hypothetical protein MVEN_01830500 [Mycena venus]|uniref:Uncharacterized protein n=1 Tax=Mycena venus TaxID=2733690 RepID=A0A8H7CLU1_9AGAR|nr:hypothetical protein MVEN_01830500 [Mycena venus]